MYWLLASMRCNSSLMVTFFASTVTVGTWAEAVAADTAQRRTARNRCRQILFKTLSSFMIVSVCV